MAAYGDSIGAAYGAYQGDRNARTQALQFALAQRAQQVQQQIAQQQFQQQMAERARAQQMDEAYRRAALAQSLQAHRDQLAQQAISNAANERYFNEIALPRNKADIASLELKKNQPTSEDLALNKQELADADWYAQQGLFDPKKYKTLSPQAIDSFTQRNLSVQQELTPQLDRLHTLADALNKQKRNAEYIQLSQEAVKELPSRVRSFPSHLSDLMYGPLTVPVAIGKMAFGKRNPQIDYENQRIKDWQAENAGLTTRMGKASPDMIDPRTKQPIFDIDAETGEIVPANVPAWYRNTRGIQMETPPATAAKNPATMPPKFYDRVNQLISNGISPINAKRTAVQEYMTNSSNFLNFTP